MKGEAVLLPLDEIHGVFHFVGSFADADMSIAIVIVEPSAFEGVDDIAGECPVASGKAGNGGGSEAGGFCALGGDLTSHVRESSRVTAVGHEQCTFALEVFVEDS